MSKKRTVAYCRVSTSKNEQLDSFQMQQQFFREYCEKNPKYDLIHIYADEGKSGTKMKIRTQLLEMLEAAKRHEFDVMLVKDVSRLARNVKDFLEILEQLQKLKIKILFINYNLDSEDGSTFQLNLLALVAQEESGNTSKRIKLSKRMNAEKGRVPNIVFGYDKTKGDYFNLSINEEEAKTVHDIFKLYVQGYGENKIANLLNEKGLKTKRSCRWTQNAISRILKNQLYTGVIINGQQEVVSFLTGKREKKDEAKWHIIEKPELRIVSDELFKRVQTEKEKRIKAFRIIDEDGKEKKLRKTEKYLFSQLIKCKCCGYSFMRFKRTYKNTYIRWKCSQHYGKGIYTCPNPSVIDEGELITDIKLYFAELLKDKSEYIRLMKSEFTKQYKEMDKAQKSEKELLAEQKKLKELKQKEMEFCRNGLCTMKDVLEKTKGYQERLNAIEQELNMLNHSLTRSDVFKNTLNRTLRDIETMLGAQELTNEMLCQVIDCITVDQNKKIHITLKNFTKLWLKETVQITDNRT